MNRYRVDFIFCMFIKVDSKKTIISRECSSYLVGLLLLNSG